MLGNFSFGDYFKHDAIQYAWELLTQVSSCPRRSSGSPSMRKTTRPTRSGTRCRRAGRAHRAHRRQQGARYASDNFWMMGDTGPCGGPCTEIFYDHGPRSRRPASGLARGRRRPLHRDLEQRVHAVQPRRSGVMHQAAQAERGHRHGPGAHRGGAAARALELRDRPVRQPAGGGRRRWMAGAGNCDTEQPSLKVIADHIRACTFTVTDGVIPGNEGRGYVLRRIIARRAIRHGYKLGAKALLPRAGGPLVDEMGEAYPSCKREKLRVTEVLKQEEERFFQTIANGMGSWRGGRSRKESGEADRRRDRLQAARHLRLPARPHCRRLPRTRRDGRLCRLRGGDEPPARTGTAPPASSRWQARGLEYDGVGHHLPRLRAPGVEHSSGGRWWRSTATARRCARRVAGDDVVIVLDGPPFYAESGGQVGDRGELRNNGGALSLVEDTQGAGGGTATAGASSPGEAQRSANGSSPASTPTPAPDDAQPQRHAPDAQGAARGAGRPRAAEGPQVDPSARASTSRTTRR